MSWDEVEALAARLNVPTVPVLFKGTFASAKAVEKWMVDAAALPSHASLPKRDVID